MQSWADCITGTHESSFWKRQLTDETVAKLVYSATVGGQKLSASQQSGMPLASKQDRDTSGKSRTQADLSRTWIEGCFPAARSNRELLIMCDYSLHFVASRPARVGDKLVSTRFRTSLTRGFAAIGEPDVAVCLLPGTEVAFERDVECDGVFRFFRKWQVGSAKFPFLNTFSKIVTCSGFDTPAKALVTADFEKSEADGTACVGDLGNNRKSGAPAAKHTLAQRVIEMTWQIDPSQRDQLPFVIT